LDDWLAGPESDMRLMLMEPSGVERAKRDLRSLATPPSVALLVGPEGGWSNDEQRRAIAAGCAPITLGRLTLRADTAPMAAMTLTRFVFGDDARVVKS
jgi:16S rRNA (uracil1498-N3)-methyltransferase